MDYAKKQWITLNDETKSIEQWERQLASQAAEIERLNAELKTLEEIVELAAKGSWNAQQKALEHLGKSAPVNPKFKIGSEVKVIRDDWDKGRKGKVRGISSKGYYVATEGYGDHEDWYQESELIPKED